MPHQYDVFVSAKSEDYPAARKAVTFLRKAGLLVFFSDQELPEVGVSDYFEVIDNALEASRHMLVVTSSPMHVNSRWVRKEWQTFLNEKLSGRKDGNLVTLLCGGVQIENLPLSLRQHEARPDLDLPNLLRYFQPTADEAEERRSAPRVKGDIDEAIEKAISGVNDVVAAAAEGRRCLRLKDITEIISEAISHGAGIYNSGSRIGCASIYHHAASCILKHCDEVGGEAGGPPAEDASLAVGWLRRIVRAEPEVRRATADDLAWELRFAFDSIQQIELFDQIAEAVEGSYGRTRRVNLEGLCGLIAKIVSICQGGMPEHMRAYVLRHTAAAILWGISQCHGSPDLPAGKLKDLQKGLAPLVAESLRITRYNAGPAGDALEAALMAFCAA